jgi:hypothetical protein
MKSQPPMAANHASGPLPRSWRWPFVHIRVALVLLVVQVAAASTPPPTAIGPPTRATCVAARLALRDARGERTTRSAIVVAAAAPATARTSALP